MAALEGQVSNDRPRGDTVSGFSTGSPSQPEESWPGSASDGGYVASSLMLSREHSYTAPLPMTSPMPVPFPSSSSCTSASPIAVRPGPEAGAQDAQRFGKPPPAVVTAPMEPSGERSAGVPEATQNQATSLPDAESSLWTRVRRWWQVQP